MKIEVVTSLAAVSPAEWDRLAGGSPFLSHAFFSALHDTGCAAPATGWIPRFLLLEEEGRLIGVMPLYLKTHSYGEYVFDWAWAEAYYRHGVEYYPKLLCAVPFTPVTGARVFTATEQARERLIGAALALAREWRVSSLHCLFPTAAEALRMQAHGMMLRRSVQFHWSNRGYASFEEFLAGFSHDKRKKVKQERRKVAAAGIRFRWLEGGDIAERDWSFFHRCYRQTYREHGSSPYLNLEFFLRIGERIPQSLVLILAERAGKFIAAALCVRDGARLCGRYWGALERHSGLHFETCYYQGIEYCIARGIASFEGGARGEHKLARGFAPVETFSAHWLAHPQFASAVARHLAREAQGIEHYLDELAERSPFRRPSGKVHNPM